MRSNPCNNNRLEEFCEAVDLTLRRTDEARINNIRLPLHVIEELQRTGIPASWYTAGELEDAILACSYDGTLIDDEEGDNFRDRLKLTSEEKIARERKKKLATFWTRDEDELSF